MNVQQFGGVCARYWVEYNEGSVGDHFPEFDAEEWVGDADLNAAAVWWARMSRLGKLLQFLQSELPDQRAQEGPEVCVMAREEGAVAASAAAAALGVK